jgi:hypothetical protein
MTALNPPAARRTINVVVGKSVIHLESDEWNLIPSKLRLIAT